jgi:hypothetical protein
VGRSLAWLAVAPFGAAGVLTAHTLAYRLTGTPAGESHDYLVHAPQVLALLALSGAGVASTLGARGRASYAQFALAAPVAFVLQEHVERLVHTGHLPWLLTSPVLLVGLLLQVPFALLSTLVARRLLALVLGVVRARPPRLAWPARVVRLAEGTDLQRVLWPAHAARGPPALGLL